MDELSEQHIPFLSTSNARLTVAALKKTVGVIQLSHLVIYLKY